MNEDDDLPDIIYTNLEGIIYDLGGPGGITIMALTKQIGCENRAVLCANKSDIPLTYW